MARKWTGSAAAAVLILMFTVGCNTTPGSSNSTPQAGSNVTNNSVVSNSGASNSSGANTTTGAGSTPSVLKAPDAQSLSTADMEKIASNLISRYIQSHNDKTLAQFKSDTDQIFYPGLASFIVSSARSGVDYNHPVKSHSITIGAVAAPNSHTFVAEATLELHFQDGTSENHHYQFSFALNAQGNWTIQSMRGA